MAHRILIATRDAELRAALDRVCRGEGHVVERAERDLEDAARRRACDAVLLDLAPDAEGARAALAAVAGLGVGVIALAEAPDCAAAVDLMRRGAEDVLAKPVRPRELERALAGLLARRATRRDGPPGELEGLERAAIVGSSPALAGMLHQLARVAAAPTTTVLIEGEAGVGKRLVARAVHENSARREGPFVGVACAASRELEVAGTRRGPFDQAAGGTLFLDAVGELAPERQAELARLVRERAGREAGAGPGDVRVIASSHEPLAERVAAGAFREDLFYRLNVMALRVPPLRERAEDVPTLATHFLARFAEQHGGPTVAFTEAAMRKLVAHRWPGNVRELENAVERAVLLASGTRILPEHLELGASQEAPPPALPAAAPDGDEVGGEPTLRELEESHIRRVLARTAGNRSRAARILGVNRTTLYSKLRRYGIEG